MAMMMQTSNEGNQHTNNQPFEYNYRKIIQTNKRKKVAGWQITEYVNDDCMTAFKFNLTSL